MGKYSFAETTIGDILDNEDAFELFKELAPEAIGHPMLEIGRPFTIDQALPFIVNIAEGMGLGDISDRIDDFKAKLEAIE